MRYLYNPSTNPYFNLAAEEFLLRQTDDEIFMLWQNAPCIVVGKNQNTLAEINEAYVREKGIAVVRRQTGGGAVFHDLGNVNYTFIVNDAESLFDFKRFCRPVTGALAALGVKAEFSGRNDLLAGGKKFSGNAQCRWQGRVMHHGTILVCASMAGLSSALRVNSKKFADKSVSSVASRVTNLSAHLAKPLSAKELIGHIFAHVAPGAVSEDFTPAEKKQILKLSKEKYETWDWNYGRSPAYRFQNEKKFPAALVQVGFDVKDGVICAIDIWGDFFSAGDIGAVTGALTGVRHDRDEMKKALAGFEFENYIKGVAKDDFIDMLFD